MPGTVVMGVIFVDIKGFPFGEYHATGTNLGSIRFVHGGVARNVAEDMARIGSPVTFVTLGDTKRSTCGTASASRRTALACGWP